MTMPMGLEILLVEDNEGDIEMTRRAFQGHRPACNVSVANDGVAAIEFLSRQGAHADAPSPRMILLDLNMPRMGGLEFLRVIKADADFRSIPVIVLTTSREESDRVETFQLSVAGYMIKPADYRQFVEVVRTIDLYWTLSELPD
jgi:CheY-like chemotaxis protein